MAKLYKVLVNDGNGAETKPINVTQGVGDKGTPVRIVAQRGVRYELQDTTKTKNTAPDQVRVKRVGKNLTLMFDGSQTPDVVVEDFYAVGSASDGTLPTLAGLELRVRPDAGHVVHAGVGDLRLVQSCFDFGRAHGPKHTQDQLLQLGAVGVAQGVGVKTRIAGQRRIAQHHFAKHFPLAFVLQAQHHRATVACGKRAIGVDAGV